ncbi:hypothetical protein TNCV_1665421 [Trichonephila clavipes]|nr:hypothetical protein TNCV_1665421 [Trichonephila clavipes]
MLEKVIENWTSRLDYIRASRGSPMPEIIFKIVLKQHGGCGSPVVKVSDHGRHVMYHLSTEPSTTQDPPSFSHEWDKARVRPAWFMNCCRHLPPAFVPELLWTLLDEENNLPQDELDHLILDMPRRCTELYFIVWETTIIPTIFYIKFL